MSRTKRNRVPRRTKILATIGPASDSPAMLKRLFRAGVNATRQNFSHGTRAYHTELLKRIHRISMEIGIPVACLQDLQGPRIRTGLLAGGKPVRLLRGAKVRLSPGVKLGDANRIAVAFRSLSRTVKRRHRVLLADGTLELRVLQIDGRDVLCRVARGGMLGEHKGVNLPDSSLKMPALTAKDRVDLKLGARLGFDYVAVSFVRRGLHVRQVRRLLEKHGSRARIIAKIETREAVRNLDEILDKADGIMVARGDLAVETSPAQVPVLQKEIIRRTNERAKLVITATEMLASMVHSATPTRAEASDVANAVFDHTDAVMLSGETASGRYPLRAVKTMASILSEAEKFALTGHVEGFLPGSDFRIAAVNSASVAAETVGARCIAVFTISGVTSELTAEARPPCPIVALTVSDEVKRRLALVWGVSPVKIPRAQSIKALMASGRKALIKNGFARSGEAVVFIGGVAAVQGATNLVLIEKV